MDKVSVEAAMKLADMTYCRMTIGAMQPAALVVPCHMCRRAGIYHSTCGQEPVMPVT